MIVQFLEQDGFRVQKKTATEFCSACPACGGDDRFVMWPGSDRYWCRNPDCGIKGDSIQYLRDFHGMTFKEAAEQVGKPVLPSDRPPLQLIRKQPKKKPQSALWRTQACKLTEYAHEGLLSNKGVLEWLHKERGLTVDTAAKFNLGWLYQDYCRDRRVWGLEDTGKKMFIPSGLVIPWQDRRIRIRRDNHGEYGRYHVLPGSSNEPMIIGSPHETLGVIVESELDAVLLAQESKRDLFIADLGSAQAKPGRTLLGQLQLCPVVLVALDSDQAGAVSAQWWLQNLQNSFRARVPAKLGKDLTELCLRGVDLDDWLSVSLNLYSDSKRSEAV